MQSHEDFAHGAREILVEREVGARPVGAGAQGTKLLQDGIAGFPYEGPDSRLELLSADVEAGLSLLRDDPLHHVLGGDAGVVGSRKPECHPAPHPFEPSEHILHRVGKAVAHVEDRGHVGRGHHDHEGRSFALARFGREQPLALPPAIKPGLDRARGVLRR
jgi:hypothetical protein